MPTLSNHLKPLISCLILALSVLLPADPIRAQSTITVDSVVDDATANDGVCSLREAINNANGNGETTGGDCLPGSGADTIEFAIVGSGPHTLLLASALPAIDDPIKIDGSSQSGNASVCAADIAGRPAYQIILDGGGVAIDGLLLAAGSDGSVVRGMNIRGFGGHGIVVDGSDSQTVICNFIGTDESGSADQGNGGYGVLIRGGGASMIGGTASGDGNLISGNDAGGIRLQDSGTNNNTLRGNYIGTDASGALALPNGDHGVLINDSAATNNVFENLISGNDLDGVRTQGGATRGNVIRGNHIGTDVSGLSPLGNGRHGISLNSDDSSVGGLSAREPNTIAFNAGAGISVTGTGSTGNRLTGNAIFSNVGLGIDLGADGTTSNDGNDGDTGPNQLQNFPEITSVVLSGAYLTLAGTYSGAADKTLTLEVFASSSADPSGFGEGERFLGTTQITTDFQGDASFSVILEGAAAGESFAITAADADGNTSEFSAATSPAIDCLEVTTVADSGLGSLRQAIECANDLGGLESTIRFAFPGTAPHLISPQTALPTIAAPVLIDGTTQLPDEDLCGDAVSTRPDYPVVLDGGGLTFSGLVLGAGSDGATIHGLNIRNFGGYGIEVEESAGSFITCNFIGTDRTGTAAAGNQEGGIHLTEGTTDIVIGGFAQGVANLISGNSHDGVWIRTGSARHEVYGNYIGTAKSGEAPLGNGSFGILIGNEATQIAVRRNVIAGSGQAGVRLNGGIQNLVAENFIGTDVTGLLDLGNSGSGVLIEVAFAPSTGNVIGGAGLGNTIAFNGGDGIRVKDDGVVDNFLSENLIYQNASPTGIDIGGAGATANDPGDSDEGPNRLQNFPVLSYASLVGGNLEMAYLVDSAPANADYPLTIEVFRTDPDGQEGQVFLGSLTYDVGDAQNEVTATLSPSVLPSLGETLTATAIDNQGNTSEFSAPVIVGAGPDLEVTIVESVDPVTAGSGPGNLIYSATVRNVGNRLATGIELETFLTLPIGVTLVSLTANQGSVSLSTWTLGDLAAGGQATLNAVLTVGETAEPATDAIAQTLAVTAMTEIDADPSNDSAGVFTSIAPTLPICLQVTSAADSGVGSLRDAMACANGAAGVDTISFAIPGPGPHVIEPVTALPPILEGVVLDGTTQPGNETLCATEIPDRPAYQIVLDGGQRTFAGLTFAAGSDGSTVMGLNIRNFGDDGIEIFSSSDHVIACNFIGTDETGTLAMGNIESGLHLDSGVTLTVVGGDQAVLGNLISGSGEYGIRISDSSDNSVQNNFLGTSRDGSEASSGLPNDSAGVRIDSGSTGNTVGGAGTGNVIGFNLNDGVRIRSDSTIENAVLENSIFSNLNAGIDIGSAGQSPNDPDDSDAGSNLEQNYPDLSLALLENGAIRLTYSVDSAPIHSAYPLRIETFIPDENGREGKVFLGALTYEESDAQQEISPTFVPIVPLAVGDRIVATATDAAGNTSEFSDFVTVGVGPDLAVSIIDSSDPVFSGSGAGNLIHIVSVRNQGNLPATGIELENLLTLPVGVTLDAVTQSQGSYSSGVWTVGDLGSGENAFLNFEITVGAAAVPGEVVELMIGVTAMNEVDGDPSNDSASETTSIVSDLAACLQVTSAADGGLGSLRQAIGCANSNTGEDTITFAIPGAGPHVIELQTELPVIADTVLIDGETQPGNEDLCEALIADRAPYQVVLEGNGAAFNGLTVGPTGNTSIIKALNIRGFSGLADADPLSAGSAIVSDGAQIIVRCSFLGTDENGTTAVGNGYGIRIYDGNNSVIGGPTEGNGNLISGNSVHGVEAFSSIGVLISASTIGADKSGTSPLGNGGAGILLSSSRASEIGADRPPNIIAWNGGAGIEIIEPANRGISNEISGNSIFENGGLGIDLEGDGLTANDVGDGDDGANRLQNSPVLSDLVIAEDGAVSVKAHVDADPANQDYPIEVSFYLSDREGEEGQIPVGSFSYDTNDYDGCGVAPCDVTISLGPLTGWGVVATATDADSNTSEFSKNSGILLATKTAQVVGGGNAVPGDTLRYRIELMNTGLAPLSSVVLTDTPDPSTSLVPHTGTASGDTGAIFEQAGFGLTVTVDGPLPGLGGTTVVEFDVVIGSSLPGPTVCNQGTVEADGQAPTLTDDPGLPGAADATCTQVTMAPDLAVTLDDGGAFPVAGGQLVYGLVYSNSSAIGALGVELTKTVPDHTSFDAAGSTPGWTCVQGAGPGSVCTFPIGALAGGSSPVFADFAVTLASSLPAGVTEIVNSATISASGANGVDPNPGDNVAQLSTQVDRAPSVLEVDTVSSTSDGRLHDGELVSIPVTQILLEFSEAVTGAADTGGFLLIEAGADGVISSASCGGAQGDDQQVAVASVVYEEPLTRLELGAGLPLQKGRYRVIACAASIQDATGQALDGDADGAPGGDFRLDFGVTDSSLIENPNFDQALAPWTSLDFDWSSEDVDLAVSSGSAEALVTPGGEGSLLHPCVDIGGEIGLASSIAVWIEDPAGELPSVEVELDLFTGGDCGGFLIGTQVMSSVAGDTSGTWRTLRGWAVIPAAAASTRPKIRTSLTGSGSILVDRVTLIPMLFGDGFESGDTSAWHFTSP